MTRISTTDTKRRDSYWQTEHYLEHQIELLTTKIVQYKSLFMFRAISLNINSLFQHFAVA